MQSNFGKICFHFFFRVNAIFLTLQFRVVRSHAARSNSPSVISQKISLYCGVCVCVYVCKCVSIIGIGNNSNKYTLNFWFDGHESIKKRRDKF